MDDNNRDSYISEFIINYLQTHNPNYYSDTVIIDNYREYLKLNFLSKNEKLKKKDLKRLKELNNYFYGSDDGTNASYGTSLANNYITTINSIKSMLLANDNAVKDIISSISQIIETSSNENGNAENAKKYLDEYIIPELLKESSTSYNISDFKLPSEQIEKPVISSAETKELIKGYKKNKEKEAAEQTNAPQPQVATPAPTPATPAPAAQAAQAALTPATPIKVDEDKVKKMKELKEKAEAEIKQIYDNISKNHDEVKKIIQNEKYKDAIKELIKFKKETSSLQSTNDTINSNSETVSANLSSSGSSSGNSDIKSQEEKFKETLITDLKTRTSGGANPIIENIKGIEDIYNEFESITTIEEIKEQLNKTIPDSNIINKILLYVSLNKTFKEIEKLYKIITSIIENATDYDELNKQYKNNLKNLKKFTDEYTKLFEERLAAEQRAKEEQERLLSLERAKEEIVEKFKHQHEQEHWAAVERAKKEVMMKLKQEKEELLQIDQNMSYLNDALAQVDDRLDALNNYIYDAEEDYIDIIDDGIQYMTSALSEIDSLLSEDDGY